MRNLLLAIVFLAIGWGQEYGMYGDRYTRDFLTVAGLLFGVPTGVFLAGRALRWITGGVEYSEWVAPFTVFVPMFGMVAAAAFMVFGGALGNLLGVYLTVSALLALVAGMLYSGLMRGPESRLIPVVRSQPLDELPTTWFSNQV